MSSSASLVGRVLDGKYEIVRLLGRGGMGEVYFGTHVQLERPVAVKVLHGELVADESFAARFAREARTAAKLEHPNAVHVYDFGSLEGGSAYLVMEYIEGVTLREVVRRNARFPIGTVLELMRQAGGAVGAAHARGIIHRDIKPENMMVRAGDDGRPVLKVVDFGLAKLLENQTSQLTKGSELIGTPRYMAPEQFSGGRVDERVDVYALGCVLFELLGGRTPFEGTFMEVAGQHVYASVPPFSTIGVDVSPAVEAVVRRALEKDPAKRTPSAGELVRDLEAACTATVVVDERDAITIPLPMPIGTAAGPEGTDAHRYATRVDAVATPVEEDDLATRRAEMVDERPTLVRPEEPPTSVLPAAVVDPHTRVARKARPTEAGLEPPTASSRRPWASIVAVACVGVLAFCATAFWLGQPSPAIPQPAAPSVSAPTPQATPPPAPSPLPVPAEPEPAAAPADTSPATPTAPKTATKPKRSTKVDTGNDLEEDPGDSADVPDVEVDPEGPTPAQMRKLRRLAAEIEREQRIRALERARKKGPRPPPNAPPPTP